MGLGPQTASASRCRRLPTATPQVAAAASGLLLWALLLPLAESGSSQGLLLQTRGQTAPANRPAGPLLTVLQLSLWLSAWVATEACTMAGTQTRVVRRAAGGLHPRPRPAQQEAPSQAAVAARSGLQTLVGMRGASCLPST